jgi:hypothetical protein
MFDKREAILQRMLAILQAIAATFTADMPTIFRNRGEIPVEKMPALVLLDGREAIAVSAAGRGGILAPTIFTLQPQVFVVLKPTPDNSNEGKGEELSDYRMKLLKAFATDDELFALLGSNGEINYTAHETDFQTGSTMLGQLQMSLSLTYVLNPQEY